MKRRLMGLIGFGEDSINIFRVLENLDHERKYCCLAEKESFIQKLGGQLDFIDCLEEKKIVFFLR